ncbi:MULTISPECIES: MliC family protein [unclassified Moraxella]|uniref:MliC family protein n=1 Tax=unclassified Moraxella TaxID=2685852 RepID=UPI003AF71135
MKTLLALVPAFAVLTACTSAPIAQPTPAQVQAVQANSQVYKCDNDTQVSAFYATQSQDNVANVKITSPMLGLNQVAMVLKQDVAASGERYTLTTPAKTTYEWHVKGNEGVLSVSTQGKEYNFVCNSL